MIGASYMGLACAKLEAEEELKERKVHALERIATALGELLSRFSEKKGVAEVMDEDITNKAAAACCSKRVEADESVVQGVPRVRYANVGSIADWMDVSADEVRDALCRLQLTHEICVLEFSSGRQLVNVQDFLRALLACVPMRTAGDSVKPGYKQSLVAKLANFFMKKGE